MDNSTLELELPGFRFHPTEEELLNFYLKSIVYGKKLRGDIISFLNIYNHDPIELPGLAKMGEREWYFFVPRDRKHGTGGRPNRTTKRGFWKATGSDRKILSMSDPKKMLLGLRKTLVYYEGRAPRGNRTDWIMNEYRLPPTTNTFTQPKDIVLCKIYRKATSLKVLEQRAAMEAQIQNDRAYRSPSSPLTPPMDSTSFSNQSEDVNISNDNHLVLKTENDQVYEEVCMNPKEWTSCGPSINGIGDLTELQVPKMNIDWTQDSFWITQLRSPWLENYSSFLPMC